MKMPVEFHQRKRRSLLQALPPGTIAIITSSFPAWKSHDQFFPFRQDSNFYYLTGLQAVTPAMLILTTDAFLGSHEWLLFPRPDSHKARWEGGVETDERIKAATGVETLAYWDEFELRFGRLFSSSKTVLLNTPELDFSPLIHPTHHIREKLTRSFPHIQPGSVNSYVHRLRQFKDNEELDQLRSAISVTASGIRHMVELAPIVDYEYELEAGFLHEIHRHGIRNLGYEPIIAAGNNANILHYTANNSLIGENDCILADVGAEVGGYSADVTRVFPKNHFTDRQAAIYEAVLRVNEAVIRAVRPGIIYQSLNDLAKDLLTEEALKLNLIGKPSEITNVYMHRVTHFLGLDVHDMGNYQQTLEPGMVITIEPGLYVDSEHTGVRIEDDVLVTASGCEVLTSSIPKSSDHFRRHR